MQNDVGSEKAPEGAVLGGAAAQSCAVRITVDAVPALTGMAGLLRELGKLGELTAQCLEQGVELLALDSDGAGASATGDCRTALEVTEKLGLLVSALGTFNIETRALVDFKE